MKQRTRKALGTLATILFMTIYALLAMAVGGKFAVGRGVGVELIFFVLAGLLWIPFVMLIIGWMVKPDEA